MKKMVAICTVILVLFCGSIGAFAKNSVAIGAGGAIVESKVNLITTLQYARELTSASAIDLKVGYATNFSEQTLVIVKLKYSHHLLKLGDFGIGVVFGVSSYMYQPAVAIGGYINLPFKERFILNLEVLGLSYLNIGDNIPVPPGVDIDLALRFEYVISNSFHAVAEYSYTLGKVHYLDVGIKFKF